MRYQNQLVAMTESAMKALLVSAKAMPEDKLTWKPEGSGRSALDQLQEVAQSLLYAIPMLVEKKAGDWDQEKFMALKAERESWKSIAECEAQLWQNFAKYKETALGFPDEDLEQSIHLPFGKGFDSTMAEVMAYPYWNAVYHLGAVNFIQTLYGDWEMHHD